MSAAACTTSRTAARAASAEAVAGKDANKVKEAQGHLTHFAKVVQNANIATTRAKEESSACRAELVHMASDFCETQDQVKDVQVSLDESKARHTRTLERLDEAIKREQCLQENCETLKGQMRLLSHQHETALESLRVLEPSS